MIFWLILLVVIFYTLAPAIRRSWNETSERLDRDTPRLMDDTHLDPPEDPCRWSNYADYRICLTHGIRADQHPFDPKHGQA
jgi:hypothetical protein